jgi:hypothetical protein
LGLLWLAGTSVTVSLSLVLIAIKRWISLQLETDYLSLIAIYVHMAIVVGSSLCSFSLSVRDTNKL